MSWLESVEPALEPANRAPARVGTAAPSVVVTLWRVSDCAALDQFAVDRANGGSGSEVELKAATRIAVPATVTLDSSLPQLGPWTYVDNSNPDELAFCPGQSAKAVIERRTGNG